MLIEGFFAVMDVLDPHRLFLPAALPVSASPAPPSVVAGGVLLPAEEGKKVLKREEKMDDLISVKRNVLTSSCRQKAWQQEWLLKCFQDFLESF